MKMNKNSRTVRKGLCEVDCVDGPRAAAARADLSPEGETRSVADAINQGRGVDEIRGMLDKGMPATEGDLVASLSPDRFNRDLALLLRARWSDDLSAQDWSRVSQIVAGVSSLDPTLRIQLAWLYLKHIGREGDALRAVTATRR